MSIRRVTKYYDDEGHEFSREPIEDTIVIKKVKDGFESKYLVQDEYPDAPSDMGDDSLFIVHYHRDLWLENKDKIVKDELADWYRGKKIEQEKDYHIFPVKSLIHGGASLSLGSGGFISDPGGWDTSHVGACLASKKDFAKKDKAEEACKAIIDEWNKYLSGEVYCLVVDKLDSKKEVVDSDTFCGYYGLDEAKEELKSFEGY